MIKKCLILLIGLCFLASPAWAISPQILQLAGEGDCSIGIAGECEEEQEENIQYAAAKAWAISPAIFGNMGQSAAAGGYSYSFYFDFEDDVGAIVANEPDDLAGVNSNATRENAQAQAGTFSYLFNANNESINFATAGDAVIDDAIGYIDFYYYPGDTAADYYFYLVNAAPDTIQLRIYIANTIRVRYNDGVATAETTSTATINDAAWNRIIVGWDAAIDKVGIKINANAWETSVAQAFDPMGNITSINIGEGGGNDTNYYIDEAYIYKTAPTGW